MWKVLSCAGDRFSRTLDFIFDHKLKFLGFLQVTVAFLSGAAGIIPKDHLPYWMAANGLLGVWMGFAHTLAQNKTDGGQSVPLATTPETPVQEKGK